MLDILRLRIPKVGLNFQWPSPNVPLNKPDIRGTRPQALAELSTQVQQFGLGIALQL
jgi:hypothetical protein